MIKRMLTAMLKASSETPMRVFLSISHLPVSGTDILDKMVHGK